MKKRKLDLKTIARNYVEGSKGSAHLTNAKVTEFATGMHADNEWMGQNIGDREQVVKEFLAHVRKLKRGKVRKSTTARKSRVRK